LSQRSVALERMLERNPDDPRLRFGLAVEYLNAGELEKGAAALRAYLAVSEDEGNGWGRLGGVLAELGRADEAREAYRAGIRAAEKYGHPSLADELRAVLQGLG